ncbi:MAG: DUF4065 domain-containing protein [Acidimicrobiales bacterium]|nr:DUF4065 domain-containing protein [Acidimicrobiales bacterium]
MKLQKLLYYAQGWHLAWYGRPLFAERIEAWEMGPVVRSFWVDHEHDRPRPEPQILSDEARVVLTFVSERYGGMTGNQLRDQSHREAPWREAYGVGDRLVRTNAEITPEALMQFFRAQPDYLAHLREVDRERARLGNPFDDRLSGAIEAAVATALSH